MLGERLDGRLDAEVVDLDEVAARRGLADGEAVADAAVEEVDRAADVGVKSRGVEFSEEPEERPYGIDAGFHDPSGNSFRLTQVNAQALA